jgi:alanyl-tRNA synthetase
MKSDEIRKKFIAFFEKRRHAVIPSASLIPENDPSVLFNTAGMQPLVPYLLGEKHPLGNRLVNFQKCLRTNDLDEVGDNTHLTFFEMMGNWSLGDYFKKDAIKWSYELLTNKEEGFGLDPNRLYVTVFEGDENAPKDSEAAEIWKKYMPEERIYFLGAKDNWWSPGDNGPCGPDTEMFYDVTKEGLGDLSHEEFVKANDQGGVVEIWNDVFMEYEKKNGKIIGKLQNKNVDTGSGFERITAVVQGKNNVFETDIFLPIINKIKEISGNLDAETNKSHKIIADHLRAAVFLIGDGSVPSNKDQGYVLRKLIRRAADHSRILKIKYHLIKELCSKIIDTYKNAYPYLLEKKIEIQALIDKEFQSFEEVLNKGIKVFQQKFAGRRAGEQITGVEAFELTSTYGLPFEVIKFLADDPTWQLIINEESYLEEQKKHQEKSRSGSEQKFKGGLGGTGIMETKYHTATHLLNAALREVLGDHIIQKGSNITSERMRFDFAHPLKMTDEEKKKVENLVNKKIDDELPVTYKEMPKGEAEKTGAIHSFGDKYGDVVKVYSIGNEGNFFSREFCGGPHVENTSELGHFKILKEEAVSAGVRRIKAVLE